MADNTLFNEAGALLQGANAGVAEAGRTAGAVADQKIKQGEINQNYGLKTQEINAESKRNADSNKAAMDRTKMEQAGENQRAETRQFTTLTPQIIKGLDASQPEAGWGKAFKGGEKMQTDVLLGIMTANEKKKMLQPKLTTIRTYDKEGNPVDQNISVSYDANGMPTVSALGDAVPKAGGKGGGAKSLSDKDLSAAIDRETKALTTSAEKGDLGGGIKSALKGLYEGGETKNILRGAATQSARSLADHVAEAKRRGLDVSSVPPELLKLAGVKDRVTVRKKGSTKKFTLPSEQVDQAKSEGYEVVEDAP